jgi:hypothetical protein
MGPAVVAPVRAALQRLQGSKTERGPDSEHCRVVGS